MTINPTLEAFLQKIDNAQKIVLLTHLNPDADTLCSAIAFYDMLKRKQKKAVLFNGSKELEVNLQKLPYMDKLQQTLPEKFDLAISFDCGSFDRLGVAVFSETLVNVDHHYSNEKYGTINIIEAEMVSTTQVVYDIFNAFGWKLSAVAAQLLFTGLVSDSLSFGTDRVDEAVFAMASRLVSTGASPEQARDLLYQQHSLARIRLAGRMVETLNLYGNGQIGVMIASKEMFEETGAKRNDTEEALRMVMSMGVVETALVLRYELDGRLKGSLRSKGAVNVEKIAVSLGGGGHIKASGFETDLPMDEALSFIIKSIEKELK